MKCNCQNIGIEINNLLSIYIFILCPCLPACISCVCRAHRSQKRALDPLGQEWQTVVSCHASAGNWNPPLSLEEPVLSSTPSSAVLKVSEQHRKTTLSSFINTLLLICIFFVLESGSYVAQIDLRFLYGRSQPWTPDTPDSGSRKLELRECFTIPRFNFL